MTDPRTISDQTFFASTGLDPNRAANITRRTLHKADGGELYMQHSISHSLVFQDGMLRSNSQSLSEGFMLRYVVGDAQGPVVGNEFSEKSLRRAAKTVSQIAAYKSPTGGALVLPTYQDVPRLYRADNPLDEMDVPNTIKILGEADQAIRSKDPSITQAVLAVVSGFDIITIIRKDGQRLDDVRPVTTISISLSAERNGRQESASAAFSCTGSLKEAFTQTSLEKLVGKAQDQLEIKMQAIPAPAGDLPVILGSGAAAVMLHEAVGHGLEGDFNRIGSSAFSGRVNQRVAAPGVTIIDQGNLKKDLPGYRGSIMFDDEGVPTTQTVLIEDGFLKGYMQDTLNARLMGAALTGNGRRENYASLPMPRMTTTYMLPGTTTQEEMIASIRGKGILAKEFNGGQVDITSGKFVFGMEEAYLIEDGKIIAPVKGASLVGDGPDAMQKIKMIGNDLVIDTGRWTCGKQGQSARVGVGQPSLLMRGLTVGST